MRWDLTTRPTQRNGGGHAQDIARERQQSPPQKRTSHHQEGAREGMSDARKSDRPQKGKDQAEREELSLTRSHREGNSKRTGSPRAPGEPTGRGGSLTRRRILQA